MTDLSFYRNPDLDDGFGATAGRVRPHGGLDFAHGKGVVIPALFSGTVAEKGISSELGAYTQIRAANGKVFTYCHSENPSHLAVGATVRQGERVNYVGARGYANGPHLHLAVGNTLAVGFDYCEDPLLWVQLALSGQDLSGGYSPAPSSGVLGPVVRSGPDWALRLPQGELAKRNARAHRARPPAARLQQRRCPRRGVRARRAGHPRRRRVPRRHAHPGREDRARGMPRHPAVRRPLRRLLEARRRARPTPRGALVVVLRARPGASPVKQIATLLGIGVLGGVATVLAWVLAAPVLAAYAIVGVLVVGAFG